MIRDEPNWNNRVVDDITRKRLEHNEVLFCQVNEQIDAREGERRDSEYVCECADASCSDTVRLSHAAYSGIRERESHFFVIPGHERADLERVVERHEHYLVVEKP